MENPTRYVVKREAGGCEFVPPPFFGRSMAGMFGAGSVYLVYLSTTFFRRTATAIFGAILLLVAALPAGLGIRAWRTRRTPLSIELGGRVTYGERELCAAGTVRAVQIARLRGDEAFDYEVCLELDEGKLVSIQPQYFAGYRTAVQARPFAAELAAALGVQVNEQCR
jgi:hypothetical protein